MSAAPLSDELAREAASFFSQHSSTSAAARASGLPRQTFDSRLKIAALRGFLGTAPVLPGYQIKKTSRQTGPDGELQREWVQQSKESGEEFELPEGHIVKGVSALLDQDGRVTQQWVKTKTDSVIPDLTAALKAAFSDYGGGAELIKPPDATDADLLSVYPIADQHVGLLSWGKETGEDYDLKIGCARLRECMQRLVSQSPPSQQAIILNLGDYQHTDNSTNMTPRGGNLLDVDSRYFKILQAGVRLMMDCIDMALKKHEAVFVRNIPGNHDPHAAIALTIALGAFYAKNPRVTVSDDPSDFFYHRFGQTLIGATHGHKSKPDKMAMDMAVRCREDWGATSYHWMMFGHIHHESAKECGDVRVESFQTLAAKDSYAAGAGYNAGQSLQSITLHRDLGEIGRHRINVPPPESYRRASSSS